MESGVVMNSSELSFGLYEKLFFHDLDDTTERPQENCCEVGRFLNRRFSFLCTSSWNSLHRLIEKELLYPFYKKALEATERGKEGCSLSLTMRTFSFLTTDCESLLFRIHGLVTRIQWHVISIEDQKINLEIPCDCPSCHSYLSIPSNHQVVLDQLHIFSRDPLKLLRQHGLENQKWISSSLPDWEKKDSAYLDDGVDEIQSLVKRAIALSFESSSVSRGERLSPPKELPPELKQSWFQSVKTLLLKHWGIFLSERDYDPEKEEMTIDLFLAPRMASLQLSQPHSTEDSWKKRQQEKRGGLVVQVGKEFFYASQKQLQSQIPHFFSNIRVDRRKFDHLSSFRSVIELNNVSPQSVNLFLAWVHGVPLPCKSEAFCHYADLYSLAHQYKIGSLIQALDKRVHFGFSTEKNRHLQKLVEGWKDQKGANQAIARCLALFSICHHSDLAEQISIGLSSRAYSAWREQKENIVSLTLEQVSFLCPGMPLKEEDIAKDWELIDKKIRTLLWEQQISLREESDLDFPLHPCIFSISGISPQTLEHLKGSKPSIFDHLLSLIYVKSFSKKIDFRDLHEVYRLTIQLKNKELQELCLQKLLKIPSTDGFEFAFYSWDSTVSDQWMLTWLQFVDQSKKKHPQWKTYQFLLKKHLSAEGAAVIAKMHPWTGLVKESLQEFRESLLPLYTAFPHYFSSSPEIHEFLNHDRET